MACTQGLQNFLAAGGDLLLGTGTDVMVLQESSGAGGSFDVEAQVIEPTDQGQCIFLILVGDGTNRVP